MHAISNLNLNCSIINKCSTYRPLEFNKEKEIKLNDAESTKLDQDNCTDKQAAANFPPDIGLRIYKQYTDSKPNMSAESTPSRHRDDDSNLSKIRTKLESDTSGSYSVTSPQQKDIWWV